VISMYCNPLTRCTAQESSVSSLTSLRRSPFYPGILTTPIQRKVASSCQATAATMACQDFASNTGSKYVVTHSICGKPITLSNGFTNLSSITWGSYQETSASWTLALLTSYLPSPHRSDQVANLEPPRIIYRLEPTVLEMPFLPLATEFHSIYRGISPHVEGL
jgi:hypothetical protein